MKVISNYVTPPKKVGVAGELVVTRVVTQVVTRVVEAAAVTAPAAPSIPTTRILRAPIEGENTDVFSSLRREEFRDKEEVSLASNFLFREEEARENLEVIWGLYVSSDPLWFEIRIVSEKGARSYWFSNSREAVQWLERNWLRKRLYERNIFFGVLPREKFDNNELDKEGRPKVGGKSKHVDRALFIFADLDYKKEEEPPEDIRKVLDEQGYHIVKDNRETGELELWVKQGEKYVHVVRPPLNQVIDKVVKLIGVKPTLIIDSGYGYHVYIKLAREVDVSRWRELQSLFIDVVGGDPKTKDPARILRLAGSYNPKYSKYGLSRAVRLLFRSSSEVDPDSLRERLEKVVSLATGEREEGLGERINIDAGKIAEIIHRFWVPSHRNNLELGLVGWMIKAGVPLEKARLAIQRICEITRDEEVKKRVAEVERQYRLVFEGRKKLGELLGKAGLFQELQLIIKEQNPGMSEEEARDQALAVIHELEKVLGPRRSIIIRTPYETNTWFVNDPARGIVLLKEKNDVSGQIYRHRRYISDWYVRRVLIVKANGQYMYKVLFRNARTKEKLVLAGQLDEIVKELKRLHGVKRGQHLGDAVSAVISEFIRRKLAKVKRTAAVAGILPMKNGVKLVRAGALSRLLIREHDAERARRALELLAELRKHYDEEKFDVAINWATYAPASYALKRLYYIKQVYLLLHGEKQTGKTTLARIITGLYPVRGVREEEIPEEGQSEYRLAWKLNITTLPILEDEVQGISRKPSLIALLKRASTGDAIRWRGDQAKTYHARAPLVMTSNYKEVIDDPALFERVIAVEFTHKDYVYAKPRQELGGFKKLYVEFLALAPYLGRVILDTIVEKWGEIESIQHLIQEKLDYLELGRKVWRWVAEKLQVREPEWCKSSISIAEERPEEREREIFWELLHDVIRESILKSKAVIGLSLTLYDKLKNLYDEGLLPGYIHLTSSYLVVTASIVRELEKRYGYTPLGGARGLADRLGYKYGSIRVKGGGVVKGIKIPLHDLGKIESDEEKIERLAEEYTSKVIIEKTGEEELAGELLRFGEAPDLKKAKELARKIIEKIEEKAGVTL